DTAFGSMSYKMEEFANNSIKQFGISKLAAKQTGSTFMAMASGMGLAQDNASDMAISLTGLSADMASFYNVSQDVASTALKSIFTGETETLKQFGIVMTDANLQAYALSQGISKSTSEMTQAEKVQLRYNYVMSQTALAQGDFSKTSDSWANQTRILQEQFKELGSTVGSVIMNAMLPVLQKLNGILSSLIDVAGRAAQAIADVFGVKMQQDTSSAGVLNEDTSNLADNAADAADSYDDMADSAKKAQKSNEKQLAGFDKITKLSDDQSDTEGSSSLSTDINTGQYGNSINTKANIDTSEANGKIKRFLNAVKTDLQKIFDPIKQAWDKTGAKVITSIKYAFKSIKDLIGSIGDSFEKVWENGTGERLVTNLLILFSDIQNIIGDIVTALKNAWNENGRGERLIQSILNLFNSVLEIIHTIAADFRYIWNNETGEEVCGCILDILTNINNTVTNLINNFKKAWDENNTGKAIIQAIFDIINSILGAIGDVTQATSEWASELNLSPLLTGIKDLILSIKPIIDEISDMLTELIDGFVLPTLKLVIEDTTPAVFNAFQSALGTISALLQPVKDSLSYINDKVIMPLVHLINDIIVVAMNKVSEIFDMITQKINEHAPQIRTVIEGISDVLGIVISYLKAYLLPVIETVFNFAKVIVGSFIDRIGNIIDILAGIITFFKSVFSGDWSAAWDAIKNIFYCAFIRPFEIGWNTLKDFLGTWYDGIKSIFSSVAGWFKGVFTGAWNGIKNVFSKVGDFFSSVWSAIKKPFTAVADWFKDIFSKAWGKVQDVFSSGGKMFKGIKEGISSVFTTVVNKLLDGINWVIRKPLEFLNGVLNDIHDISLFGHTPFDGFWEYDPIPIPQIPKLATGTVVPANYGEFLAVLGDNKRETEVVSPLSTMKQAVKEAISESGYGGGDIVIHYTVELDGQKLHKKMVRINKQEIRKTGKNPMLVTV
ncbi:MAG: hypothetical protein ACI4RN_01445, partial [Oscillospiraceae bacterium]